MSLRDSDPDAVSRVLLAGIAERDHGLKESMEVAAADEIARMKRGLPVLDTIITMAPLLGILGTVIGIIGSFDLLGRSGIQDPKAVTGGIAQALITTATGLAVALVTLVPFNYFVARVQQATKILEKTATCFEIACRKGEGNAAE
jgi:biopolymer transport protein ExbB